MKLKAFGKELDRELFEPVTVMFDVQIIGVEECYILDDGTETFRYEGRLFSDGTPVFFMAEDIINDETDHSTE